MAPTGTTPAPLPAHVRTYVHELDILLFEPRRGYRFGPENLLLPALLDTFLRKPPRRIADLGAGCGVLGLTAHAHLARQQNTPPQTLLVERNAEIARFAVASAEALVPTLRHAVTTCQEDLRLLELPEAERCDLVICNPPFFAPGHGRPSRNTAVHEATHTLHGDLHDFLQCAQRIRKGDGLILVLLPTESLAELLAGALALGLAMHGCFIIDARHTERPYRVWTVLGHPPGQSQCHHLCTMTPR